MLQAELELLLASYDGDIKLVKELLAKGVNPNTELNKVVCIGLSVLPVTPVLSGTSVKG